MPDDTMCFLSAPVSEEGELRLQLLPPTAGDDPQVVVLGPILNTIRDALPGAGSEAPADGPHAGGMCYPLSLLSLLLGRMGVIPSGGDLATATLVEWVDEPTSLLRLARQAIADGLKLGKPSTIVEACHVVDTFMEGVADLTPYHLTLANTRQAEPRTPPAEGDTANLAFEVKTRDAYRVGEPRGPAESVAFFLGPRYRRRAWEGGDYSSSLLMVLDSFRAFRKEVEHHKQRLELTSHA